MKPGTIRTSIRYVVKGEKAIFYPSDRERSYWPPEDHDVEITDARALRDELTIERNGFVLLDHATRVTDYLDPQQVDDVYSPEIVALAKSLNGASFAFAFGPVVRTDDPDAKQGRLPSFGAHVDYGRRTIEEITRDTLGREEAERLLAKRVVLMNFWRPIAPVYSSPLALCDASTVAPDDMNDSEVRGGLMDPNRPPLYGFNLSYNPRHRWYYVPRMRPPELFAFKLYDSDPSRPQWTGHTAIVDPATPPDAPARQSIEIRTLSFID